MRHLNVIVVIILAFFIVTGRVEAATVPISSEPLDEYTIDWFIDHAKNFDKEIYCNIYGERYFRDKGILYWMANFGNNKKSTIKFKLNKNNYVEGATITRYMPKPTKNSFQEYRMETVAAFKEIGAV